MPHSVVIHLKAAQDGRIRGQTGRAVHGLWYATLKADLANMIHAVSPAPFSVSPLMGLPSPKGGWTQIKNGASVWFRIALLTDEDSGTLLDTWQINLPDEIELANTHWQVERTQRPHMFWNRAQSYQQIASKLPPAKLTFDFLTPVTFNSGKSLSGKDLYLPFPLPDSLFKSWQRRWNLFAPPALRIPRDLPAWARQVLVVNNYRLKTVPVRQGRRVHIGCVGTYNLRFVDCPENIKKYFSWLAHYAFFCGSGAKTTQGLGMTRLVE